MAIRVILIDDHPLVLRGLEQLLTEGGDFDVIATRGTAAAGSQAIEDLRPDVVVLDLKLPDGSGLDVLRRMNRLNPPAVVVLTASEDEEELLSAVGLGARGVVLKETAPNVLEDCIRAVHTGGQWLTVQGTDLAERVARRRSIESELAALLTPRELEIVHLASARLENHEIAARLAISVGTVKIHLHHIYSKLRLEGRDDLYSFLTMQRY